MFKNKSYTGEDFTDYYGDLIQKLKCKYPDKKFLFIMDGCGVNYIVLF